MILRRAIDIAIAATALMLLSPILVVIAIAVIVDSPGNPLYKARRVGRQGRPFVMWKFRTMMTGADRVGPAITGPQDSRITRLGRILRRTKVDELPQFINLLLGHMTLVGPRPETPEIVALFSEAQRAVLDVKPGITGRVQIDEECEADNIPHGTAPQEYYVRHLMGPKISRDLDYLRSRNFWTDTQVVLGTLALMMRALMHR